MVNAVLLQKPCQVHKGIGLDPLAGGMTLRRPLTDPWMSSRMTYGAKGQWVDEAGGLHPLLMTNEVVIDAGDIAAC